MKHVKLIWIALPMLAACTAVSGREANEGEAWQRCAGYTEAAARKACMQTEMAVLTAGDRDKALTDAKDTAAAEQRRAVLEAQGVPRDVAARASTSPAHRSK
jgi:hypothetical protein